MQKELESWRCLQLVLAFVVVLAEAEVAEEPEQESKRRGCANPSPPCRNLNQFL